MRLRHFTYWMFVAAAFIPVCILHWASLLMEKIDPLISRVHMWAYQERYK